jgi:hypothetical protein
MLISRAILDNACAGYTKNSPGGGLNMPEIKSYLIERQVHVPKRITRSNLQDLLCTHLKTLSKNLSDGDVMGNRTDVKDLQIKGMSGMSNIDKVKWILQHSIEDEDFEEPIQWRIQTLQRYYQLDDFDQRLADKTEPAYKENIDTLKKDVRDLVHLRDFRKSLVTVV